MKKSMMMALGGLVLVTSAHAEFQPAPKMRGGFVDTAETIFTIDQVNGMRDDAYVVVQGNIIRRQGDEKYILRDQSGTITIEIDDDDWNGVTVTPDDVVKIYGEVDRGLTKSEIDVERIEIVK